MRRPAIFADSTLAQGFDGLGHLLHVPAGDLDNRWCHGSPFADIIDKSTAPQANEPLAAEPLPHRLCERPHPF